MPSNRVQEFRLSRGIGAADLARRTGVSRQTIYAIESGTFVPNTTVALQLARALEARVEDLFSLDAAAEEPVRVELFPGANSGNLAGKMVRLCKVGTRLIAIPAEAAAQYLPFADGAVIADGARISVRPVKGALPEDGKRVLIAGCDPMLPFLAPEVRKAGFEIVFVPCSSRRALEWLKQGRVHAAGTHLLDRGSGLYNTPLIRQIFRPSAVRLFTFASWETGLVVRKGNPKSIRSIASLARKGVTIVNREIGAGSRDLLDQSLAAAGIDPKLVLGYAETASGHLPAASRVADGRADCCIAASVAARSFGLDFLPVTTQRFDLAISRRWIDMPAIQFLLDSLNRLPLKRTLHELAGYDTSETGTRQI